MRITNTPLQGDAGEKAGQFVKFLNKLFIEPLIPEGNILIEKDIFGILGNGIMVHMNHDGANKRSRFETFCKKTVKTEKTIPETIITTIERCLPNPVRTTHSQRLRRKYVVGNHRLELLPSAWTTHLIVVGSKKPFPSHSFGLEWDLTDRCRASIPIKTTSSTVAHIV